MVEHVEDLFDRFVAREVSAAGYDRELAVGHQRRLVDAVAEGNDLVGITVPETDRYLDVA